MRISDWSSDVCSSDLHRCCGGRRLVRLASVGQLDHGLKGELMTYVSVLLILIGLYLIDSGVKNRAPVEFLKARISSEKPDLAATLAEYDGKWTTPIEEDIGRAHVRTPVTN